jgi:hypothetical protein
MRGGRRRGGGGERMEKSWCIEVEYPYSGCGTSQPNMGARPKSLAIQAPKLPGEGHEEVFQQRSSQSAGELGRRHAVDVADEENVVVEIAEKVVHADEGVSDGR